MPPEDTTPPAGENAAEKKFSQADFDRALGLRLADERRKFDKYDEFKQKAEQIPTLETNLTKAQGEASAATIRAAAIMALVGKNVPADRIEAALKLADLAGAKLEGGKVTGVEEAITAMLTANPFMLPSPPTPGTPPAPPVTPPATGNPATTPTLTREQIEKMPPAEINKRWAEIEPVLQKG